VKLIANFPKFTVKGNFGKVENGVIMPDDKVFALNQLKAGKF